MVRDDNLDPVDRIASTLILLYAQPLVRIIALTTDDVIVTDAGTRLKVGADALELPETFAMIVRQLLHRRRASHARRGSRTQNRGHQPPHHHRERPVRELRRRPSALSRE
ncbi:hypothetical protein [Phytoactinopolyspora limicola]|uniref:hypothetical protein n=1 Tax=Phytoactinopolyspora limicola TaxID=2715536 RepID=UPI001408D89E|nr:hypothetical protein [Phytoactinopolyspora limicola]